MEQFKKDVMAFIKRHGFTKTSFGIRFANDRTFVFRVFDKGMDPGIMRVERIQAEMKEYDKGAASS